MSLFAKTLADLEWSRVQDALGERCQTQLGTEQAHALLPDLGLKEVELSLAATEELRGLAESGEPASFGGIRDLRESLRLAAKGGVLEGSELLEIAGHLYGIHNLRRHLLLREERVPVCAEIAREMPDLLAFADLLSRSFEESGRLKDTASPDLGHLRQTANRLSEQLKKTINRLLGDTRITTFLQDNYYTVRDDRYVLPVRAEHRAEVKGIVHGTSQSGATLFIEPEEMVDLGNRYKIALAAVEREERRILAELTGAVVERAPLIQAGLDLVGRLDLLNARALLAKDLDLARPTIEPADGELLLLRARHPHLLLQKVEVVPNDIELSKGARALVISGPNTGGKTVSLKTAGLCALFLRAGMPIPAAEKSRIPFYQQVFSDIGDEQSLERNLSTFSGRVLNTLAILKEAKAGDLVLLDEIAAGTEPAQGAAFACSILEALAKSGAHVLTSTHYELPKTLALKDPLFRNASVGFDEEHLAPTYRLHLGIPGRSNALEVATRLGAPASLIERAKSFLSDGGRVFEETLAALEREKDALEEERRKLARARKDAEEEARRARKQAESFRAREKALTEGAHQGLLRSLIEARALVEKADRRLRERQKHPKDEVGNEAAVKKAREALSRAQELEKKAADRIEAARKRELLRTAARLEDLVPGRSVYVASLKAEGVVEAAPDEKGRVRVRVGTLKTQVPREELSLVQRERRPEKQAPKREAERAPAPQPGQPVSDEPPPMTSDITLDLRGMRVDEALAEVDSFLDQMLQRDRTHCYFIHGHGTGAIKQAVREFLQKSPLIAEVQPGGLERGGDGITLARMA